MGNIAFTRTPESQSDFENQVKPDFGWEIKAFAKKGFLKFADLSHFWASELSELTKSVDPARATGRL